MKILIIMGGFFPGKKYGGPPVSVDNFCSLMSDIAECYIFTHNHDLGSEEPYDDVSLDSWNDRGNCYVKYVSDNDYCRKQFAKTIDEIKPDCIYLQGLFQSCVLPALQIAQEKNIKVLLAPRGELCSGAFKIKKYKKRPYVEYLRITGLVKNVSFQSTSDEETEAIHKLLNIPYERIYFLNNIPSIPAREYPRIRKEVGKGRFVFLSRIHPKKNLFSAIKYFDTVEGEALFDIYGPIEDEAYWRECQYAIETLPQNVSVKYCGLVSHDMVHETFSRYDAFLFPTLSENYGHVIAESLCVGTPVIISDQTPWSEINGTAGWVCSLNDISAIKQAIQQVVNKDHISMNMMSTNAQKYIHDKYNVDALHSDYIKLFENH